MPQLELDEVVDLIDRDRDPLDKATIETAIQAMLFHQVVFEDTPGLRREVFQALRRHKDFFERYFRAAGFGFHVDSQTQMIALETKERIYGWKSTRLKKDETLVRIVLRLILDEGWKNGSIDENGRVISDTDEVVDTFRTLQAEPPAEPRLREILADLARIGAVRVGDRDRAEKVTDLILLPGLRVHVPDAFLQRVIVWVEQGCPGEMFEAMAEQRRTDQAQPADEYEAANDVADTDTETV